MQNGLAMSYCHFGITESPLLRSTLIMVACRVTLGWQTLAQKIRVHSNGPRIDVELVVVRPFVWEKAKLPTNWTIGTRVVGVGAVTSLWTAHPPVVGLPTVVPLGKAKSDLSMKGTVLQVL